MPQYVKQRQTVWAALNLHMHSLFFWQKATCLCVSRGRHGNVSFRHTCSQFVCKRDSEITFSLGGYWCTVQQSNTLCILSLPVIYTSDTEGVSKAFLFLGTRYEDILEWRAVLLFLSTEKNTLWHDGWTLELRTQKSRPLLGNSPLNTTLNNDRFFASSILCEVRSESIQEESTGQNPKQRTTLLTRPATIYWTEVQLVVLESGKLCDSRQPVRTWARNQRNIRCLATTS
jgi:hypothetical protein